MYPERHFDVIVLGGGPAGTSAAIPLAQAGRTVLVLERSRYEQARIGETLPPKAWVLLNELGVWERFQKDGHAPSPGTLSAWGQDELYANEFIFRPYGPGWHIDRRRFDEMLAEAAEDAGATVCRSARLTSCLPLSSGEWEVGAEADGKSFQLRANFLIDATGRASWLATRQGARRLAHDRLVGVIGFLIVEDPNRLRDQRTVVEACADGWWYSALLPGQRLAAAFMTDADLLPHPRAGLAEHWQERVGASCHTRLRLEACSLSSDLRVVLANSCRLDRIAGENWLAVGDAAAAFDPLSARGISQAVEAGLGAARAIEEHRHGRRTGLTDYCTQVEKDFADYLRQRTHYYRQEQRWSDSVFWQRRR